MKFFGKGTTTRLIEDPEEKRDKLVKVRFFQCRYLQDETLVCPNFQFFTDNIHNKYNIYYFGFIFCEFLNLVVVLAVFLLTDRFLHYKFMTYGFRVWSYYSLPVEEQRSPTINPMCETFPRIAACSYHRFGGAGEGSNIEALCILALNVINDKVFLVIWWWLFLLVWLGVLRIIFRSVQMYSARLRFCMLNLRMHRYFKRNENIDKVKQYIYVCSRGDWFVLYQLSKNLNRPFFMDFLVTLCRQVDPDPEKGISCNADPGDGIMDMMLKPTLATYESRDDKSKNSDDDDD